MQSSRCSRPCAMRFTLLPLGSLVASPSFPLSSHRIPKYPRSGRRVLPIEFQLTSSKLPADFRSPLVSKRAGQTYS